MHDPKATDRASDSRHEDRLLDVLIRAGLMLASAMLCFQIFSPFLVLMVWALILMFVAGVADNVLNLPMLGRGVDAPISVILLGALGGMAPAGILGLIVGATLFALGYQIFMGWVAANPVARRPAGDASEIAADSARCA